MSQASFSSADGDRHSWNGNEQSDMGMTQRSERGFVGVSEYAWSSAVVFLLGIIIIGVATWAGVGGSQSVDCLLAGLCCLSGAMVGHIPLMMLRSDEVDKLPTAIFMGTVLRTSVAMVTIVALIVSGTVNVKVAAFSFFGWYAVYLIIDLVHGVRSIAKAFPASAERPQRTEGNAEAVRTGIDGEPLREGVL